MTGVSRVSCFFGAWATTVVVLGGALTSFHQPFQLPEAEALSGIVATNSSKTASRNQRWSMTHLLSGGCGCSRRVMLHLLQRQPLLGVSEKIVLIDGEADDLPGTTRVLVSLRAAGFDVTHVDEREVAATPGFHGVPLLMVTSPAGEVDYLGGYGPAGDKDVDILRQVRFGDSVAVLPVLGCAVGSRTKRLSDPFRLKY